MIVNFNRFIGYLLILITVMVTGCSDTAKAPLSGSYQAPALKGQHKFAMRHSKARPRLTFSGLSRSSIKKADYKSGRTQAKTVWDRLLALYSLPEIENERVERQINWYLDHPDYLVRIQERAEPYLHLILDEVEAKNIPGELALLPVVESAFIPHAYSRSDASGLWQFIPATGRLYGLEQNAWYDGRRDVYASTKAATKFLKGLGETFDGDWFLALAAYNYGKGNVRKAIERNEELDLPTDYWSLDLPRETADYVPRLLAVAKLFANAEEYDIPLQNIPNKPYFEVVDIKSPIDLSKAAELANTPLTHFLKLNPGFNRSCTAPNGPHRLLVPVDQAQTFKRNLALLPYSERVDMKQFEPKPVLVHHVPEKKIETHHKEAPVLFSQYKVRRGDTLASIASRAHTSINTIRKVNHLAGTTVRSNTLLKIPSQNKADKPTILAVASKGKSSSNQLYTVKKGDTVWKIAQRFSVSPQNISQWNKVGLKTALVAGRKLTIKSVGPQLASTSSIRLVRYNVHKGDTLMKISRKFNVSLNDLRKSNADTLVKGLRPGQTLKILVDNNGPAT